LCDIWDVLKLQLLVVLDLELRLEVVCAEFELYLRILVASDCLVLVDYRVREAGVERLVEDALGLGVTARAI
jgi:cephalosporin hydroxylase